jgi:hypothetical protein
MNWDAIGAISEIVGALSVVITLIYLAVQVRMSRIQSAAETTYSTKGRRFIRPSSTCTSTRHWCVFASKRY